MGFYLARVEGKTSIRLPESLQFGALLDLYDMELALNRRLERFISAASGWIGERIPIVSTEDVSEEELFFGTDDES